MSQLYIRTVILTVVPASGQGKKITDLRITFKASKNDESKPNTMDIEVYNLSEQNRALLESKNAQIVLEAGYDGKAGVIFKGNITRAYHEKEGGDIISKLEVADGGHRYRNARIEKGIPPGAKTSQVLDELIKSMGLVKGAVVGVPNSQYANGISLSGLSKDRLDDICRKEGLQWSIQDGAIQIIPETQATNDSAILVSSNSGLIGSPSRTKEGIEFKMLLNTNLRPGRRVKIEGRFLKGDYKITQVEHSGDSHEGEFISDCKVIINAKKSKK